MAASAPFPFVYDLWVSKVEQTSKLSSDAPSTIADWAFKPRFSVLLYADSETSQELIDRSKASVEGQIYPNWRLEGPGNPRPDVTDCDYVVPLRAGDVLASSSLFRLAEASQPQASAAIIYGDQDELHPSDRRRNPWFKPDWNAEMFLGLDFIWQAVAIRSDLASRAGIDRIGLTSERLAAALLQATADAGGNIVHVPHIITHVPRSREVSRLEPVRRHLRPSDATCSEGLFGTIKVSWPLPAILPTVSIIVPTKDKLELLRPCVESVLGRTDYEPFELIIVDNGSVHPETLAYLADVARNPAVRVLPYKAAYNFSAINNFAVKEANGSFLCLLNNDTEVVESGWLTEMMRYAVQPHIGAVGAKLLYEDGTIQHAGVVIGVGGAAGHAHRFTPSDKPGYFRQPHVAQFVSAVTAACLVVSKEKFEAVDGLDEDKLAVAFNDVDLCLKLQEAGWRNVYVPHAVLLHHESKSRGSDFAPERVEQFRRELKTLQQRWGTKTYQDPLHNPNLDRNSENYVVRI